MRVLWFDVTEIQEWHGHYTGIQRVIFNIGKELSENKAIKTKYCRYDRSNDIFVETNYNFVEHKYIETPGLQTKPKAATANLELLLRLTPTRVKRVIKRVINSKAKIAHSTTPSTANEIIIRSNDILFTPGAFWTGYLDALQRIKVNNSPKIVGIIYDLVPLVVPQFSAEVTVQQYNQELPKALNIVEYWFAISKNSKKDLLNYAQKEKISLKTNAVKVVRLGSDINTRGVSTRPFKGKEVPERFILFVSTLEARKNHILVYQAIKLAQKKGINLPPVILVGKRGWLADDLIYTIRKDTSVSQSIRWYEKVDDKGLRWLYQNCLFSVYPAHYEGWGLPVAESLAYRKPCIAARTSSIPEIAGGLIDYFSPYSAEELLHLMDKMSNDLEVLEKANKQALKYKIDTWQKLGEDVLNRVNKLF